MSPRTCRIAVLRVAVAALAAGLPAAAVAQLRLPSLGGLGPGLRVPALQQRLAPLVDQTLAPVDLLDARLDQVAERLRQNRRELDRDPHGELVVRGELLAQPSDARSRDALLAAGFVVLREDTLDGLDLAWLVLRPPPGMALADAVERARSVDPAGVFDYHHVYLGSGVAGGTPEPSASASVAAPTTADAGALRVGLVDSGVDASHPVFKGTAIERHGCDGAAHPAAHGTAVASLMVGQGRAFASALPHATLYAGDAYCDAPTGGSVEAVARELAWLARERVAVVNVSLVGPDNRILQRVIEQAIARGMLVVAAVGNDGPAAPPLYPASWPGVVGVGAVDARRRLLPEDARGPQVMFVAPGADMAAAASGSVDFLPVRGTSFAAPIVAGLLAASHQVPSPAGAQAAIARLAATAREPAGSPVRDGYGRGLVGETLRTAPEAVTLVRAH
jgi:subtilisin family serine protease